jgi:NAD-dependent SIR2 family protein deacetylase
MDANHREYTQNIDRVSEVIYSRQFAVIGVHLQFYF